MHTSNEITSIKWAYIRGFFLTLTLFFVCFAIATYINRHHPVSQQTIDIVDLIGVIFDGTALFGIVHVHVRSLNGLISQEKVNYIFLLTCVSIGLIFYFFSHLLKPVS